MNTTIVRDKCENEPIGDRGNLISFLHILKKAHAELVGIESAHSRFVQIRTKGHAKKYMEELMPLLLTERERRKQV